MIMRILSFVALLLLHGPSPAAGSVALGTSGAVDEQQRIWIAYAEPAAGGAHVRVARFDTKEEKWAAPLTVNTTDEPVSADGENRPKLAFGPRDEMYVSWTSPTSGKYTADIRFSRSLDNGKTWSQPVTVHRDRQRIAHRFESLSVDARGRIWLTWIDKRDLITAEQAGREYSGAAIYYAYSDDRGTSWHGDFKLADQSCECCRIATALDSSGNVHAMWRHVFPPNERDHAFAKLTETPAAAKIQRATFDRWAIDACPHHGPGLAFGANDVRHAVWFNQIGGNGRVFYGQLSSGAPSRVRELPAGAMHADIAALGATVAVAWKRFDGTATRLETWLSSDNGATFAPGPVLSTSSDSDQPRLVRADGDIFLVWRRPQETSVTRLLAANKESPSMTSTRSSPAEQPVKASILPFGPHTLEQIERRHANRAFWLVLWDMECTYCMRSLTNIANAQQRKPDLRVVTITTDPLTDAAAIGARLAEIGIRSENYAFSGGSADALRYAIDSAWAGEKPRAYRYTAAGEREPISGVLSIERIIGP
jgi:hypothetical protein